MITSRHNPRLQAVRRLQAQAKSRLEEGAFVVEGVRLSEEALQSGWTARQVFYSGSLDPRGRAAVEGFTSRGVLVQQLSEAAMQSISATETPQGLLVVLEMKALPIPSPADFLLILDGVRDPGNLGAILRAAAAARVGAMLLAPGNADPWSPKVLRAGMGAHFHLPVRDMSWDVIRQSIKRPVGKMRVYLADTAAGVAYTVADFRAPLALIVGGEAAGAGDEAAALADEKVHIPMPGASESLNAAVAAGILLFEVLRQRGE